MTSLHPTFGNLESQIASLRETVKQMLGDGSAGTPTFKEGLRLVVEVEDTPQNRALLRQIESMALADKVNASYVGYQDGDTAYCQSCHEAMPYFHTEYHNCLKEAN